MPTVWEKVTENAKLLSLPGVYLRLREVLDDPDFCVGEVADVISHDPAMTARLLRLVNSAYFGLAARIDTVNRAVSMLGTQQIHDLVLAASVADTFARESNHGMDIQGFWRKSVKCAIACRELAVLCNVLDSERVFVAGLLREIGHMIMYQSVPGPVEQAMVQSRKQAAPLFKVERVILGIDYAKVGGALMRQWNLPRSLWEPTEFHVEPAMAKEFPLFTALVHVGAAMADGTQDESAAGTWLNPIDSYAWRMTGLSPEQCRHVPGKVEEQLAAVMHLIFPEQQSAIA